MKVSLILALAVLLTACQAAFQPTSEQASYRLIQGDAWRGVKVGGVAPRMAQSICQNQQCYRLFGPLNYPQALLHKYSLQGASYNELAQAVGADAKRAEVELPVDLGQFLFNEARQQHFRSMQSDSGVWVTP